MYVCVPAMATLVKALHMRCYVIARLAVCSSLHLSIFYEKEDNPIGL